uniref:Uncharacterized protein n=1 Tax=Chenopodium quinoa TaxID=63459 RepID=A0A803MG99_CHEQI
MDLQNEPRAPGVDSGCRASDAQVRSQTMHILKICWGERVEENSHLMAEFILDDFGPIMQASQLYNIHLNLRMQYANTVYSAALVDGLVWSTYPTTLIIAGYTYNTIKETLSALSELQPEHVRLLLTMVNNRQQDNMTETGDIFVLRDVKFYENEFPYVHKSDSISTNVSIEGMSNDNVGVDQDFLDELEHILEVSEDSLVPENPPSPPVHAADPTATATAAPRNLHRRPPADSAPPRSPPAASSAEATITATPSDSSPMADPNSTSTSSIDMGRGQRERHPPSWHRDYIAYTISLPSCL